MLNNIALSYFLWFLVVLAVLMYGHTALRNPLKVEVSFLGTTKKTTVRSLVLIAFLDGAAVGALVYFLIANS